MNKAPLYEASIKVREFDITGQNSREIEVTGVTAATDRNMNAAKEAANRDIAGIIQGFKLLKDNSHEEVGIKDIENPETKAKLLKVVGEIYSDEIKNPEHKTLAGYIEMSMGKGRMVAVIPISHTNLVRVGEILNSANKNSGNTIDILDKIEGDMQTSPSSTPSLPKEWLKNHR